MSLHFELFLLDSNRQRASFCNLRLRLKAKRYADTEPDDMKKEQPSMGQIFDILQYCSTCPASWTQIIEQLTCERARYHVSADKMQCGQRMFSQKGATLKVHRSRLPKAVGVERSHYPLTSPPTLLRQECDTPTSTGICTN